MCPVGNSHGCQTARLLRGTVTGCAWCRLSTKVGVCRFASECAQMCVFLQLLHILFPCLFCADRHSTFPDVLQQTQQTQVCRIPAPDTAALSAAADAILAACSSMIARWNRPSRPPVLAHMPSQLGCMFRVAHKSVHPIPSPQWPVAESPLLEFLLSGVKAKKSEVSLGTYLRTEKSGLSSVWIRGG